MAKTNVKRHSGVIHLRLGEKVSLWASARIHALLLDEQGLLRSNLILEIGNGLLGLCDLHRDLEMILGLLLCQWLETDERLLLHKAVLQFDLVQQLIQQLQSLGRKWLVQDLQFNTLR